MPARRAEERPAGGVLDLQALGSRKPRELLPCLELCLGLGSRLLRRGHALLGVVGPEKGVQHCFPRCTRPAAECPAGERDLEEAAEEVLEIKLYTIM